MSEPVTSVDKPTISVDDLDAWDNLLSPASTSPPPTLRSASSSSSASSGVFNAFSFVGAAVAGGGWWIVRFRVWEAFVPLGLGM